MSNASPTRLRKPTQCLVKKKPPKPFRSSGAETRELKTSFSSRLHILEELLHTVEEAALLGRVVGAVAAAQALLQLTQQSLLLFTEVDRCFYHHTAQQVARRATAYRLDTLAAQAEEFPGLGFGWDLELDATIQRDRKS